MARPLWNGTISFGLVSIPIEVHSAVRDVGPHFHLLRSRDKSRVKYEKVAADDGKPVSKDELVKGYEYAKGRFVVMTDRDFESAALDRRSTIDIIDFVAAAEVDDRYFDTPYYLTPGKGGDQAYVLLREGLRQAGRLGIAKFVMHGKQHLAAVEVIGEALVLSTMRFHTELVDVTAYAFPKARGLRKQDLELARTLIDRLAAPWTPEKYHDDYRDNLMAIIEAREKHATPHLALDEAPKGAEVVDLMERLRRSLGPAAGKRLRRPAATEPKSARKAGRKAARAGTHASSARARKARKRRAA